MISLRNTIQKIILNIPIVGNLAKVIYLKLINPIYNIKTYKLYKTKNGNYYLPQFAIDDAIRNIIIEGEIYQKEILEIAKKYVSENTAVLDLGANYGQLTIEFSKLKKNTIIYSFEAQKFIFNLLEKNVDINNVNAKCYYNLVGNESKNLKVKIDKLDVNQTWGSNNIEIIKKESEKFNTIKAIKIDDLKIEEKISFMKIDIQGGELNALKGAKNTILKNKMPILFEYTPRFENVYKYDFKNFEDFINEIDYRLELRSNDDYLILPRN